MPLFSFADGAAMYAATPIENMFLMEYLPVAPEGCLRVYLSARMLGLHPELGGDLAAMAASLRMDEDAVYSALAYWEQQGLARRLSDRPPAYELLPVRASGALTAVMDRDYYEFRDFNASLQELFPAKVLLHPQEYSAAQDWVKIFGFDQEAVLLAVRRAVENYRGKRPNPSVIFKRLDKRMVDWSERGIRSAADLERELRFEGPVKDTAKLVAERLTLRREPTLEELDVVRRWLEEWGFDQAQVLEACEKSARARTPSFGFVDSVLKNMREQGPHWAELSETLKELNPASALPTPDLLSRYAKLRQAGFEAGMIRLAAVQCHRGNRYTFDEVERMLGKWRGLGLDTQPAAEAYVQEMERRTEPVRGFLEKCGRNNRPSQDDVDRYEAWQGVYSAELIDYAAECAKGAKAPVKYADKLLAGWARAGVDTVQAARAERERGGEGGGARANPALDYAQRTYRDEDFGDDFFYDATKEYGNGGDQK